jgi:hypothetical protein
MNHYLIAPNQILECGMIAIPALLQPNLFLLCVDHVALLLIKTNGRDKSFEKILEKNQKEKAVPKALWAFN